MSSPFTWQQVGSHTALAKTHLDLPRYEGKVRDVYDLGQHLLLVSTDRLSAFDRALALIPYKGVVLTAVSAWWFKATESIIANHFIDCPAPNVMRVRKCRVFPIEVIVRGYITGTTNTALWTLYQQGERRFFETTLPEGLYKNAKLDRPILTPTTKEAQHDVPLAQEDMANIPGLTPAMWDRIASIALQLFDFASSNLQKQGLILADTKYEFGLDEGGALCLVDEIHTPDSSRYWEFNDWQQALLEKREPASFDKEMIRLWYRAHCNPYEDKILPEAPSALIEQVSARYLSLYAKITGTPLTTRQLSCVESLESLVKTL